MNGFGNKLRFQVAAEHGVRVKLGIDNRDEKLGTACFDLNDKIAAAIALANLDPDKEALSKRLQGRD